MNCLLSLQLFFEMSCREPVVAFVLLDGLRHHGIASKSYKQ